MSAETPPPRVGIGLAVYNGGNFLAEALESILAQTFTDFELIISDNHSTDGTEAICRAYAARDSRIRYVRNERNLSAAPNLNRGPGLRVGRVVGGGQRVGERGRAEREDGMQVDRPAGAAGAALPVRGRLGSLGQQHLAAFPVRPVGPGRRRRGIGPAAMSSPERGIAGA